MPAVSAAKQTAARMNMISQQLLTNRITDMRIVEAMSDIPRDQFVPDEYRPMAYVDADIPLLRTGQRVVLEPLLVARMIQLVEPEATHKVLEIGAGSGYASAIYSRMAHQVWALEQDDMLGARAGVVLSRAKCHNVEVVVGALERGVSGHAPYDIIHISGGVEQIPASIIAQLKDGGRLVCIQHQPAPARMASVVVGQKIAGVFSKQVFFETAPRPVLPGFAAEATFEL